MIVVTQGSGSAGARLRDSQADLPAAEAAMPADADAVQVDAVQVDAVFAKAADENFPVALRMLPPARRRHLMAAYVFARTVDDIGDQAPVSDRPRLLAELEADVRRLYRGLGETDSERDIADQADAGTPRLAAVRGLAHTVAECQIPMQPFADLILANQQDQVITRYETFDDLLGYCRLSANPVGRIVLHVFGGFTPARAELSDFVCTGLQLAEHWQDVGEDFRNGRVYLPSQDMRGHGCTEQDLAGRNAPRRLRQLIEFEVGRASAQIDAGAPLIGTLRGAARVAVAGYVAGGRAALAAIAAADYDVLAATPRPGRGRTAAELVMAFARGR